MKEAERELIRRAQQGDGWAFEQLVGQYDRPILALARDMVGNIPDAQDVYQEALLAAFRGLPRFRMDSDFSTWLYRIAVNQALRFRRRRQRRRDLSQRASSEEVESWSEKAVRVIVVKKADVFTEEEARRVFEDYRVQIERDGNNVSVSTRSESRRRTRSLELSVKVVVPRPYSVDVETGGGGISIGDLKGNAKARTSGGGIDVGRIVNGSVDVRTSGGGISIESIRNGDGRAITSGGGINVGEVTGNLTVKTSGGGIDVGEVGGELSAETGGGGISIGAGGMRVAAETGGGGISIDASKGPVSAKTGGGGISIEGAEDSVKAQTGGGGITVEGSGGPVVVQTGGGGISIEDARGYIEAKTGGGGISAELAIDDPAVDTHCNLDTGGGDVTIHLPAGLQATIDAELRLKRPKRTYTIESDFPLEIEGDPDSSDRLTARGDLNGGGDVIRVRTTNGDVKIKKR